LALDYQKLLERAGRHLLDEIYILTGFDMENADERYEALKKLLPHYHGVLKKAQKILQHP
jgi:hypothetical protein